MDAGLPPAERGKQFPADPVPFPRPDIQVFRVVEPPAAAMKAAASGALEGGAGRRFGSVRVAGRALANARDSGCAPGVASQTILAAVSVSPDPDVRDTDTTISTGREGPKAPGLGRVNGYERLTACDDDRYRGKPG